MSATLREAARRVTIPLQFLLQWDDERMERHPVPDLFDAFGSKEKTLHANLGGHAGTPWFEVDDAARFVSRHLRWPRPEVSPTRTAVPLPDLGTSLAR